MSVEVEIGDCNVKYTVNECSACHLCFDSHEDLERHWLKHVVLSDEDHSDVSMCNNQNAIINVLFKLISIIILLAHIR
jgi:hypothetical protein